jgi:hypothetical protein
MFVGVNAIMLEILDIVQVIIPWHILLDKI